MKEKEKTKKTAISKYIGICIVTVTTHKPFKGTCPFPGAAYQLMQSLFRYLVPFLLSLQKMGGLVDLTATSLSLLVFLVFRTPS